MMQRHVCQQRLLNSCIPLVILDGAGGEGIDTNDGYYGCGDCNIDHSNEETNGEKFVSPFVFCGLYSTQAITLLLLFD